MLFVLIFMVNKKELHVKLLFIWPSTIPHVQLVYIMTLLPMYVYKYVCMYVSICLMHIDFYVCSVLLLMHPNFYVLPHSVLHYHGLFYLLCILTSMFYLFRYYITMVYTVVRRKFFVGSNRIFPV